MMTFAEVYNRVHAAANVRLGRVANGSLAHLGRPTVISIGITARCNARCVHCNIWRNKGPEELATLADWKRCLSELRDWLGPVQVTLTGGEALLRAHVVEVVAHGSAIGLLMEHLTHGFWRDQTRVEALARARPWRITMSLDGIGAAHDMVRGRAGFFDAAMSSLDTIRRVGRELGRDVPVRLKTVIMEHNLHDVGEIARFAQRGGYEVFYQPIEQNYASAEDPDWHLTGANWPRDPAAAVAAVQGLIEMKLAGYPIANAVDHLERMIAYFRDPDASRVAVQRQSAGRAGAECGAKSTLLIAANGDVTGCYAKPPFGNIRHDSVRVLWRSRPRYWQGGCCLEVPAATDLPEPATALRA
jgi:MoaA/NifB/PqqE/SkfB family radical SAM enzyme